VHGGVRSGVTGHGDGCEAVELAAQLLPFSQARNSASVIGGEWRASGMARGFTAVCASLGKILAVPEPALGVAGRDGAQR
jgi:hypothetical protein